MNLARLKVLQCNIKDDKLAKKINTVINKNNIDIKPTSVIVVPKSCPECKGTNLSNYEGVICTDCGIVVKENTIDTAEENSVNFSKASNRSSSYMEYNEIGSAYNLVFQEVPKPKVNSITILISSKKTTKKRLD